MMRSLVRVAQEGWCFRDSLVNVVLPPSVPHHEPANGSVFAQASAFGGARARNAGRHRIMIQRNALAACTTRVPLLTHPEAPLL